MAKNKPMNYGEMLDGLFDFYTNTIAKRKNKKYEYNGPNTTSNCILVTSSSVKEQLSKEQFEFRLQYRDDHEIRILLNCALQLGIQQGINLCSENPRQYLEK